MERSLICVQSLNISVAPIKCSLLDHTFGIHGQSGQGLQEVQEEGNFLHRVANAEGAAEPDVPLPSTILQTR